MKNKSALKTISNGSNLIALLLLGLSPLLVIPYTRNLIVDSKTLLLFLGALIVVFGFGVKVWLRKKWELAVSPLTLPLILFGGSVLVSTFFTGQYPVEDLLGIGGSYLAVVLLGVFGSSLSKGDNTKKAVRWLGISGAILSLSMVLQQLGWGPSKLINLVSAFNLPDTMLFNISGSSFVAVQILALTLIGLVSYVLVRKKMQTIDLALIISNVIGLGLGVWSLLPNKISSVTLTPFKASWTIMLRSLESFASAIIGHGPSSYTNMFAQLKPIWINGQDYWQFNFGTATNTPLTLVVTLGAVGLLSWLFLVFQVAAQAKKTSKNSAPLFWMLLATFMAQVFVPTNIVILTIQAALIMLWISANQNQFNLLKFKALKFRAYPAQLQIVKSFSKKVGWFVYITAIVLILSVVAGFYGLGKSFAAYHYMYRSDKALSENRAVDIYENQRLAVQSNPYLDSLRREYALVNLQMAVALSNNADITEEEQNQVVQLISQAIREGRAATLLDPADVENWTTLSQVYQNLIGVADEADEWVKSSLVSAIQVNPTNPLLRIQLGQQVLLDDKAEDAVRFFAQAAELKPDLPAAYYNIGLAFNKLGQIEDARLAWEKALELLPEGSNDYLILSEQMNQLGQVNIEDEAILEDEVGSVEGGAEGGAENEADATSDSPSLLEQQLTPEDEVVNPNGDAELDV